MNPYVACMLYSVGNKNDNYNPDQGKPASCRVDIKIIVSNSKLTGLRPLLSGLYVF